jgi:hypothetical protein
MARWPGSRWRMASLLMAGCGASAGVVGPTPVSGPVVASPMAVSPPSAEPEAREPGPVDACVAAEAFTTAATDQAEKLAREVMARLVSSGAYTGEQLDGAPSYSLTDWISCLKTPGGAWALELAQARLSPRSDYDWRGEWYLDGNIVLLHVDTRGHVVQTDIETESNGSAANGPFANDQLFKSKGLNCCDFVFGGLRPLELFDFDGDGEPEVHVMASYGHEGVHEERHELFTFRRGRIERYGAAPAFDAMRDETGDGRPDLFRAEGLGGREQCGSGFPGDGEGLSFMAHSLPDGTFSTTDEAARAHAKKLCPARPSALTDFSSVLCARLWGGVEADLEQKVRKQFSAWDCELPENKQKPGARGDYELMLSATGISVPFTLP